MNTPYFDFGALPDELFLKILEYLPFKEQVRLSRVNSRFNEMSRTAIAHRKNLIFDENLMQYLWSNRSLSTLLDECSPIVKRIVIEDPRWNALLLQPIFQYQYPRLVEIIINAKPSADDSWVNFQRSCIDLIGRCPALKSFVFPVKDSSSPHIPFRFPENMTAPNLENLVANYFDDESFRLTSIAAPYLKNIKVTCFEGVSNEVFDQFCAAIPNLERITFSCGDPSLKDLICFWRLPLKTLVLPYLRDVDDQLLNRILASFPNLESIAFSSDAFSITDVGLRALFQRSSLRSIEICIKDIYYLIFVNAHFFIGCVDLEILRLIYCRLAKDVFIKIIRQCSHLKIISVYDIIGLDSEQCIIDFLPSFADMNRRRLQISFNDSGGPWMSENVAAALRLLKENGGAEIEITDDDYY